MTESFEVLYTETWHWFDRDLEERWHTPGELQTTIFELRRIDPQLELLALEFVVDGQRRVRMFLPAEMKEHEMLRNVFMALRYAYQQGRDDEQQFRQ